MTYPINLLERELHQIQSIILNADWSNYQEALKDRESKVKQLKKAIELLKNENNG